MPERLYFDCNASYGPRTGKHHEERWTLQHLLADMDLAGIAGALVCHAQSLEYDPMLANLQLVEDIAPHRDRLFPCWTAVPDYCDDGPDPETFLRLARENDVRAVRIAPATFGVPARESAWCGLRDMLRQEQMPVLVSAAALNNDFDAADRLLSIFKDCPVILTDASWGDWRQVALLMHDHPHLHLEFSMFQGNRAVEWMAERFGADRCLYGSGLPARAPGAARGFLDWTLLENPDANAIASGNLARLLKGAAPERIPAPAEWDDALTRAVRSGSPLPCPVLDNHCHVLHDGANNAGRIFVMPEGGIDGMIELTRRIGIDTTAIMSWAGPLSGDTDRGNDIVANALARYPDELLGVPTIRPELQTDAEMQTVIDRFHTKLRCPGLKPFPRAPLNFDDPGFDLWFRYANEHHLYMVFDPATQGPAGTPVVEHLVKNYPNITLSLDHCGKSWPYAKWAVEMCNRFPQVFAQLNYTLVTNGIIEYIVQHAGADRVLFGTDAPMRDPRPQASWLVFTRLPEEAKRLVFGGNFQRILKRCFP